MSAARDSSAKSGCWVLEFTPRHVPLSTTLRRCALQADDFRLMIEQFPDVRRALEAVAQERIAENRARLTTVRNAPVDAFLAQGLMEAQSLLVLDLSRCTRCDQCVRACADAHDGVSRLIRDGLRLDKYLIATSCRQCKDPLCMVGCPVGSIRRKNSLEMVIEDWCIGCGLCANNCPYGNINLHPFKFRQNDPTTPGHTDREGEKKATACNLCLDYDEPSCVYACPHDAAHRVNPSQFFAQLAAQGGVSVEERRLAVLIDSTHRVWIWVTAVALGFGHSLLHSLCLIIGPRASGWQRSRDHLWQYRFRIDAVRGTAGRAQESARCGVWGAEARGCGDIFGWAC